MNKKIILIALSFSIPIILISSIMIYLVEGPIKWEFLKEHSQNFIQEATFIDSTLEQLEMYIANWGSGLREDHLMEYPLSIDNFQEVNEISERIFLLENISPLIESATLAVHHESPYYLNSGGTWPQTSNTSLPPLEALDLEAEFQWVPHQTGNNRSLYFVQNLRPQDGDVPIFLFAGINLDKISNLLQFSTENSQGFQAYLIDEKLLTQSGPQSAELTELLSSLDIPPTGSKSYAYEDYSVVTVSKDYINHQWTFASIVPISTLVQPIQALSSILFVSAFLLIVGTILYSYYVSKREYQPVYELMKEIANGENEWEKSSTNATEYLKNQWLELQEEKKLLVAKSKENEKRVKRTILNRMIRGELSYYSEEELWRNMEESGWKDIQKGYQFYAIQLTELINGVDGNHHVDLNDFILNNLLDDLAEKHFPEFTSLRPVSNCVYIFVSTPSNNEEIESQFVSDVFHYVNQILKRHVTVTASPLSKELKALPKVFNDLSYNRFFHEMENKNQFLFSTHHKRMIKIGATYPIHYERMMMDQIRNHKKEDLYSLTHQFIEVLVSQHPIQIYVLEAVKQLYDALSFLLLENGLFSNEYVDKEKLLLHIETHFNTATLADELYQSFIEPVYELYHTQTKESLKKEILMLRDYLDEHFQDVSLSLEQSAEKLGIDPYLLSKEFKRYIGMNYIDYITTLRIDHAKHLLMNTDIKINTIAEKIGYNGSYFNRLFKKKVGVTPGQYREQKRTAEI